MVHFDIHLNTAYNQKPVKSFHTIERSKALTLNGWYLSLNIRITSLQDQMLS